MKILRTLLLIVLAVSILLTYPTCLAVDEGIKIVIDEKPLVTDVAPTIISGRTLVPLRAIFEAMGSTVSWDENTSTVTAKKDTTIIIIKINDKFPTVNGKTIELDVAATVVDGRTLVPVRFIAESLGTIVDWDSNTQTVIISSPKVITFKDKALEEVIRNKLEMPDGDLKTTDVISIEELEASNKGIETLRNLTKLDLSRNKISNIAALKSLTKLKELNINSNKIKSLNDLTKLAELAELKAQYNPLTEFNGLLSFSTNTKIYLIDGQNPVKDLNEKSLEEYKAVIIKATEITSKVVNENMSDIEKQLALHDYLAMNTTYDTASYVNIIGSDKCHFAYGALVEGNAVCDGYSKAMEILLNMVGIECMMVVGIYHSYSGRPGGHAWNIAKIDGEYYHFDVTFNDRDGDKFDVTHRYLNLSDRQMSAGYKWDRSKYPSCVNDNKDFDSLDSLTRQTIYTDDAIYKIASNNVYKIHPLTSEANKLTEDKATQILLQGNWIYYINTNDQNKVYRISLDGKD